MKTLIVELDNTLAAFVGSPMFTNPQVVDAVANAKARADLAADHQTKRRIKDGIRQTRALRSGGWPTL